ncbi:MAG TPA: glutathione S-transferase family protein [Candidatus Binatia bacterium]|nr:glutathione S-transferase family protein [Candidatus Binatia bacterium]
MITLYHSAQSRSGRPRWMLEEIGVPYEITRVNLQSGDQKKPEYLKLNPNGTVPTLVDGDTVLWESGAIVQYLADRFPEKKLAPAVGTPERGRYYQWVHYAMSGLEPPAVTIFMHSVQLPESERLPQLVTTARTQLEGAVKVVDDALAGRDWILGQQFSAADVMVGSTLVWCQMMGLVGSDRPNVAAYLARCAERPALQRANAD